MPAPHVFGEPEQWYEAGRGEQAPVICDQQAGILIAIDGTAGRQMSGLSLVHRPDLAGP